MVAKMKAAVLHQKYDLRVENVSIPKIERNEALVKVRAAGICATDIHIYNGVYPVKFPVILGHEFSGEIIKVGHKVDEFQVGDNIIVDPNIACGKCYYCKSGRRHFCGNWQAIGITRDGAYAEYVKVPVSNLYKMPKGMSFEEGALSEPVACCIHGMEKLQIKPGDYIVVLGLGSIGLIFLQLAKAFGAAQIIGIDLRADRLEKAKKLGASAAINVRENNWKESIKSLTGELGADAIIDTTGDPTLLQQSIQVAGYSCKILIFGVPPKNGKVLLDQFDIYRREIAIIGSFTNPYTMIPAIKMINSGVVDVKTLITNVLPIESILQAFELIRKKTDGVVKIMIKANN